ncbi:MAG: ABC transporter substrate-binding protein [Xanthobacteraceae bacterium]
MRRRDFISLLGGATVLPHMAHVQSDVRRVGVLMNTGADSAVSQERLAKFLERLREAGWIEGRNLRVETRWGAGDTALFQKYAAELAALSPDVVLVSTTPMVTPLLRASRTIPIVFVNVVDPVGSGLVASLAHPGGNATGFVAFEYALAAKWLEILTEIAPHVTRTAVLREVSNASGIGQFAAIQTAAATDIELSVIDMDEMDQIERAVAAFAANPNGGLIVTANNFGFNHPGIIVTLAARYKLPAVYPFDYYVRTGGLASYGPDLTPDYHRAADYVDRILRGEKPADLPVQAPTKYELIINLRTAKALGLAVPQTVLARADEVIE